MATFNPRAKKFVNLTFHTGTLIDDPESVLEGEAKEARVFRVKSGEELGEKKAGLEMVVRNWIANRFSDRIQLRFSECLCDSYQARSLNKLFGGDAHGQKAWTLFGNRNRREMVEEVHQGGILRTGQW
jgi:hypothetical protein